MEMVRRLLGETLFTQRFYWQVASLVLLAEAGLCALVIRVVPCELQKRARWDPWNKRKWVIDRCSDELEMVE